MSLPPLVIAVDELYAAVVMEPEPWNEARFIEWAEAAASPPPTAAEAKQLRRAMRAAVKLRRFWSSADAAPHHGEPDWMVRVDIAAGTPAWRPTLDLGVAALEASPNPDLFAHVAARFRMVTGQTFAGGRSYDEWLLERQREGPDS